MASNKGKDKAADKRSDLPAGIQLPPGAQLIDDGDVDTVIALDVANEFVGRFLGSKEVKSEKMKNKDGNMMHRFRTLGEEVVGVWGAHQLDQMLGKVESGQWVWILRVEDKALENGNTMKQFKVAKLAKAPTA